MQGYVPPSTGDTENPTDTSMNQAEISAPKSKKNQRECIGSGSFRRWNNDQN